MVKEYDLPILKSLNDIQVEMMPEPMVRNTFNFKLMNYKSTIFIYFICINFSYYCRDLNSTFTFHPMNISPTPYLPKPTS